MVAATAPIGPFNILIVSAWCGLVAGLVEVATIVVRKDGSTPIISTT